MFYAMHAEPVDFNLSGVPGRQELKDNLSPNPVTKKQRSVNCQHGNISGPSSEYVVYSYTVQACPRSTALAAHMLTALHCLERAGLDLF